MHLLSVCRDREGWVGGLGGFEMGDEVMGGVPRRGDSGGRVSQAISDTGEPRLTYGVASRMYFTAITKKRRLMRVRFIFTVKTVTFKSGKGTQNKPRHKWWRRFLTDRCLAVLMHTQNRDFSAFQRCTIHSSRNRNNKRIIQARFHCVKMSEKHKRLEEGCGDTTDIFKTETVCCTMICSFHLNSRPWKKEYYS